MIKLNAPEWKSISVACFCSIAMGLSAPLFGLLLGDFVGILSNPDTNEVKAQIKIYAAIFTSVGVVIGLATLITVS